MPTVRTTGRSDPFRSSGAQRIRRHWIAQRLTMILYINIIASIKILYVGQCIKCAGFNKEEYNLLTNLVETRLRWYFIIYSHTLHHLY